MIFLKNARQLEIMKEGGRKLALIFEKLMAEIKPGKTLKEINQLSEELILKEKGFPSFKMVKGYKWATCININQGVVHGVPDGYKIEKGDLVSLDIGMFYGGFHTDMARTFLIGNRGKKSKNQKLEFLKAGKKALKKAIAKAKAKNRVGHISLSIEREIKKAGFSPIEVLTGHGIGQKLHEEPQIPCFLEGNIKETPLLEEGMTLAIEVIYSEGKPDLILKEDNWTLETADGSLAAVFENTVAITKRGPLILTPLEMKLEVC